jgi:hypothetical protein
MDAVGTALTGVMGIERMKKVLERFLEGGRRTHQLRNGRHDFAFKPVRGTQILGACANLRPHRKKEFLHRTARGFGRKPAEPSVAGQGKRSLRNLCQPFQFPRFVLQDGVQALDKSAPAPTAAPFRPAHPAPQLRPFPSRDVDRVEAVGCIEDVMPFVKDIAKRRHRVAIVLGIKCRGMA